MAQWRVLSWNVETFGETKGGLAINFIGRVIGHYSANLVVFLETTKLGHAVVIHDLLRAFNLGVEWQPFVSDIAGKSFDLPPVVEYARRRRTWFNEFYPYLSGCYDNDPIKKELLLKPAPQWQNVNDTKSALEYAGVVRPDYETYTGIMQVDPAVSTSSRYIMPGSYIGLLAWESVLVSTDGQGNEIGYRDPQSIFNGRSPFVLQMLYADPSDITRNRTYFPMASFHAPFGDSSMDTQQKTEMRVQAINSLLRLGTRVDAVTRNDIGNAGTAMISGDFNVDYTSAGNCGGLPTPIPATADVSVRAYCPLDQNGFIVMMGEKSSLTTVKKADRNNASTNWLQPSDYLVNAYDNVMVKGTGLVNASEDPEILDLLQDIYDSQNLPGGNYLTGAIPVAINSMYDAFVYYRKNISDHLPALANFEINDRP